ERYYGISDSERSTQFLLEINSMSSFQELHQPIGRIIRQAGKGYHFFGGTAYLGLSTNEEYTELFKEGVDRYGLNNGTSRSNNVQLGIYKDAESNMASR